MKDNPICVEIVSLPITAIDYSFSVQVILPITLPAQVFTVSMPEVLARSPSERDYKRVIEAILAQRVLGAYNKYIEDAPLMDMLENPERYALATRVCFDCVPYPWNRQDSNL